ncbi:beta strand repeat-containing protein, partial [Ramlibacter sp.]|uniref:beta strand repeat-containing protein n=1 Tax=Ramlibacter sp. TaxID=1917967 RepID=UPI003D12D556
MLFDGAMVDTLGAASKQTDAVEANKPAAADHAAEASPAVEHGPVPSRAEAEKAISNLLVDFDRLGEQDAKALKAAVDRVDAILKAFAESEQYAEVMLEVFGRAGTDAAEFSAALESLRTKLAGGGLGIELVVLSAKDMQGAAAAYTSNSHIGIEAIYVSADWLELVTPSGVGDILLEELGHAMDQRLNGGRDSSGDEGEYFAALLRNEPFTPEGLARVVAEDDSGTLQIGDKSVAVEFASRQITQITDNFGEESSTHTSSGTTFYTDDQTPTVRVALAGSGVGTVVQIRRTTGTDTTVGTGTVTATDDANDYIDITLTTSLANNTAHALAARTGTSGGVGTKWNLVVENTAPTKTVSGIDISNDSGTSNSDFLTNATSQTITATLSGSLSAATATAGAERLWGSVDNGTTWTDITGSVSGTAVSWTTSLLSGANTIQLQVRDTALNRGTAATRTYTVDTTAPNAPSITSVTDNVGTITGAVASGGSTDDTVLVVRVSLTGTNAVANDLVQLRNSTTAVGSAVTLTGTDISNGYVDITTPTLTNGTTYAFNAIVTDVAGNAGAAATNHTVTVDTTAPTVSSVAITSATGAQASTLNAGDVVNVTVTMSEAMAVTGSPTLTLQVGSNARTAAYNAGASSGSALVFSYTIQAGDTDTDGIALNANALGLNGGTIRDTAGNTATITHALVGANASYMVDTTAPTAPTAVLASDTGTSSSDGITSNGQVNVANLEGGATWEYSTNSGGAWTAGSGSNFTLSAGTYAANAVQVRQIDAAGNVGTAVQLGEITVDAGGPTVSSVAITSAAGAQNSTLNAGDTVTVTVTMSEATTVTGTPEIALDVGGTGRTASYTGGSGTTTLTFAYTVQAGDTDANGISIAANALALAGGTFKDAAGNDAALAHGAASDNAAYKVDTGAPTASVENASVPSTGQVLVQSSELGTAYLVRSTVTVTDEASIVNAAGNLWNAVAIAAANTDTALAATGLVDGTYKVYTVDAAGNVSAASANTVTVDSTVPTVTGVAITGATGAQASTLNAGDIVTVTVTMSEATTVTGSPQVGLNVGGQTRQAVYASGSGSASLVFEYTVQAGDTDANGISVDANALGLNSGTLKDAAGNDATLTHASVADNASYTVDTTAPTIAITSNVATLKAGETATITFTFSEDPDTSFDATDISVSGGTLGALSGTGLTRTATFTPTADSTANGTISVASSKFTDAAGNLNTDGGDANNTVTLTIDSERPTVAITSNAATLKAGETATITFTFSEDPDSSFDASDIAVSGGTLGTLSGTGLTRTATFTPTADSTANGTISVASSKFTDAAGNLNTDGGDANNAVTLTIDSERPTVAITSNVSTLKAGETATVTFTFTEDPGSSFDASDIAVSGGTLGTLSGTGLTRTATFTPTADSTASGTISVASSKFTDAAGNLNTDGGDANNAVTLTIDSERPTVAITSNVSTLKAGETATITFTFSEDPDSSFDASDIAVSGGTLGTLSGTGLTRTATFTPTTDSTANGTISVASSKFTDAAGNLNTDGGDANNTVTLTIDSERPTVAIT